MLLCFVTMLLPALPVVQVGGIRRIVVPVELGYPDNNYRKQGPKPTTFSVRRRPPTACSSNSPQATCPNRVWLEPDVLRMEQTACLGCTESLPGLSRTGSRLR